MRAFKDHFKNWEVFLTVKLSGAEARGQRGRQGRGCIEVEQYYWWLVKGK